MIDKIPAQYKLRRINIAANDGSLLPVSVIGSGQPVLMLHAFGMDARQFLPFILSLAQQYRFYLPHFRRFGLATDLTLPKFDFIEQYVEDTQQVLQHITMKTNNNAIPVAAISMGALVMWGDFQRFGSKSISRYLNIDQAPIIHNQPDWQGGLFGLQQAELFIKLETLVKKSAPYLQVDNFGHLPYNLTSSPP